MARQDPTDDSCVGVIARLFVTVVFVGVVVWFAGWIA